MKNTHARDAQIFKALCDEKRLAILELLREGEKCACVLIDTTSIAQSALSYHMKILTEAGIVTCRHDGKYCHYSLDEAGCTIAKERLESITTAIVRSGEYKENKEEAVLAQCARC